jgi:ABC-type nitrate/sulfonate/bicarbonate transport system permease component
MKRYRNIIMYLIFLLLIFSLFEFLVRKRIVSAYIFAAPSQIAKRFWEMSFDGSLWGNVFATLRLTLLSASLGFLLGVFLALLMIRLKQLQSFFEFVLDFLRSIPLTTLIPVFIVMYGIGNGPKVAIGSLSALLTTALTIFLGLKQLVINRSDYFKLYEPSWKDTVLDIYLKEGSVYFFTAIRLSISISLVLVIVSEMFIGTESGLGKMVMDKTYTDDRAGQFAIILLSGIIGWSLNKLTLVIQNRFPNE